MTLYAFPYHTFTVTSPNIVTFEKNEWNTVYHGEKDYISTVPRKIATIRCLHDFNKSWTHAACV